MRKIIIVPKIRFPTCFFVFRLRLLMANGRDDDDVRRGNEGSNSGSKGRKCCFYWSIRSNSMLAASSPSLKTGVERGREAWRVALGLSDDFSKKKLNCSLLDWGRIFRLRRISSGSGCDSCREIRRGESWRRRQIHWRLPGAEFIILFALQNRA